MCFFFLDNTQDLGYFKKLHIFQIKPILNVILKRGETRMAKNNCRPSAKVSRAGKTLAKPSSTKASKSTAGKTLIQHKNTKHK